MAISCMTKSVARETSTAGVVWRRRGLFVAERLFGLRCDFFTGAGALAGVFGRTGGASEFEDEVASIGSILRLEVCRTTESRGASPPVPTSDMHRASASPPTRPPVRPRSDMHPDPGQTCTPTPVRHAPRSHPGQTCTARRQSFFEAPTSGADLRQAPMGSVSQVGPLRSGSPIGRQHG